MFITPNMGLTAWDQGTDNFDHSQLANNMTAIDNHRHIPGEGRRIPSAGIEDLAITGGKIAANAITPDKIPDGTISQIELAKPSVGTPEVFDAAITNAKVAPAAIDKTKVDSTISFVGEVRLWYRATASISPPLGWEVLDGRPWSSVPNAMGVSGTNLTTGNMPDPRNKYILGAALTGTGSGPTTPPDLGALVGSHTIDLSHSHTVNAHNHPVNAHSHTMSNHYHTFTTSANGDHGHTFAGGLLFHSRQTRTLRQDQTGNDSYLQTTYVAGFNSGGGDAVFGTDSSGNHAHTGTTDLGGAIPTSADTATTQNASPGTSTSLSTATDIRPASIGLLLIMRVI